MAQDFHKDKEPNDDDLAALERLEKDLDKLEYLELLNGLSDEDLKASGLSPENMQSGGFRDKTFITEKEHLVFQPKIDFYRVEHNVKFEDVLLEDYLFVRDTEEKTQFASQNKKDALILIKPGINIVTKTDGDMLLFYAEKRGKVLIIDDTLHLIASDSDYKIEIVVAENKLSAHVNMTPGYGTGLELSLQVVKDTLLKNGISFGICDTEIEAAVLVANETGKTVKNVIAAVGAEPVQGKDGYAQFDFDLEPKEYGITILPDGRIDYRNITNIPMVKKDCRIAHLIPPKEGAPGTDIYGNPTPPQIGKPAALIAGNGILVSKDGSEFFASIDGTIILNGTLLEVMDSYIVQGDLDYTTGNISFTGNVLVNGTVLEGFEIKAGGDIIIAKNVESTRIEAGRDVIIMGGVLGKGKGLIAAGRDIRAGYVQNARLEAQGNIIIKNFAVNSYLFTAKELNLTEQRGSIIGGEAYARISIIAKHIGSPSGTKTYVETGTDYLLKRKIAELDEIILFCTQNIEKIELSLHAITQDSAKYKETILSKKSIIKKAIDKKIELENRLKIVTARRNDLSQQLFTSDTCFIKVKDNCYPDVLIKIRDKKMKLDKMRTFITIKDNRASDTLEFSPY